MSRQQLDPADPPPSLEEQYSVATSTSDLGLPHGDAAGAQGILAAAAWTEVHLGSALRRLRSQWEAGKPRKKVPRTRGQLIAAGMPSAQAKRQHNRELVQCSVTYVTEKKALRRRIPEYHEVLDHLTVYAARHGIEEAETKATTALHRWLDDPTKDTPDQDERKLSQYLRDCLSNAKRALKEGMRGRTNHHPEPE